MHKQLYYYTIILVIAHRHLLYETHDNLYLLACIVMQDIKMSRKDRGMSCVGDGLEGQPVAALDGITGGINPHLDSPSKQVKIGSLLRLFQRSRGPHIMTCQQLPISVFLPISSIDIPSIVYESATVRKDVK